MTQSNPKPAPHLTPRSVAAAEFRSTDRKSAGSKSTKASRQSKGAVQQGVLKANDLAPRLLAWQQAHGRHDLPWQIPDPYAVWVSEIMLQQTQVKTVLKYYARFMQRFNSPKALAEASFDEVAPFWAGLGYYARARNLHKAAKVVAEQGFPESIAGWEALPGIGRSTAGAIHALGQGGYGPIMDGNVKRVLSRWLAFDQDPKKAAAQKALWQIAEQLTPKQHSGRYAQALMDLGSLICTRSKPKCGLCPISSDCQAHLHNQTDQYPIKSAPTKFKQRCSLALKISVGDQLLWFRAQAPGIWGELWCLPLIDWPLLPVEGGDANALSNHPLLQQLIELSSHVQTGALLDHRLTHIAWQIQPLTLEFSEANKLTAEQLLRAFFMDESKGALSYSELVWMDANQAAQAGLPKPMHSLINPL